MAAERGRRWEAGAMRLGARRTVREEQVPVEALFQREVRLRLRGANADGRHVGRLDEVVCRHHAHKRERACAGNAVQPRTYTHKLGARFAR